jgi:tetratricopeptide (TPR) repeat protein
VVGRYDREIEDVFAIQDDISQAIARALRVILTEGEKAAFGAPRPVNVQAYDYYLRGRQFFHLHRRKSLEYAVQMYEKAIEIDPDYALAYAGIAIASSLLYTYFDSRELNLIQAVASRGAGPRQLASAPSPASPPVVETDEAEAEFEAAIELDQVVRAFYFFGRTRRAQGRHAEAISLLRRRALRPEDFRRRVHGRRIRGHGYASRRPRLAGAIRLIEQRHDPNRYARAWNLGATTLAKLGNEPRYGIRGASL